MPDRLDNLFQQAKLILSDAEQRHRGVYDAALDISDFTEARRVSAEAQRSILKVREWRRRLDDFFTEIASTDILTPGIPSAPQADYPAETDKADAVSSGEDNAYVGIHEADSTDAAIKPGLAAGLQLPVDDTEESKPDPVLSKSAAAIEKPPVSMAAGRPKLMKLLGKTRSVSCWNDIYIKVCELMLLHKPYVIAGMDGDTELSPDKRVRFSYVESDIAGCRKRLPNGLWIETDGNEDDCVRLSYGILEKCGYAPESLTVEFREE